MRADEEYQTSESKKQNLRMGEMDKNRILRHKKIKSVIVGFLWPAKAHLEI